MTTQKGLFDEPDPPVEDPPFDPSSGVDEPETIPRYRESSIRSFYNAVDDDVVETRLRQAWVCLRALGPSTQNEVIREVQRVYAVKAQSLTPRFAELRDAGLIREVDERECTITGVICLVWEVVPPHEYVPPALVKHRCPCCGQLTGREIPRQDPAL